MDFRIIKFPQTNSFGRLGNRVRSLPKYAPNAEALLERVLTRFRPAITRFYTGRRRLATAAVLVLTVWLFAHIVFGANGMVIYRQKRGEYGALEKEVTNLQQQNQRITEQIKALKSSPEMIEKEAREQLHYARPGEVVYITPTPPQSNAVEIHSAQK